MWCKIHSRNARRHPDLRPKPRTTRTPCVCVVGCVHFAFLESHDIEGFCRAWGKTALFAFLLQQWHLSVLLYCNMWARNRCQMRAVLVLMKTRTVCCICSANLGPAIWQTCFFFKAYIDFWRKHHAPLPRSQMLDSKRCLEPSRDCKVAYTGRHPSAREDAMARHGM